MSAFRTDFTYQLRAFPTNINFINATQNLMDKYPVIELYALNDLVPVL
jgi:hypothetical protein